jgi:hypothetical protein
MRHGLSVVEVDPDFIGAAAPARPTASSATRATPTPRSGSRTWRRIRRASTTAPTPSSASRSSLRTGPDGPDHAPAPPGDRGLRDRGPEQRLRARERVHAPDREVRQLHEAELLPRSYGRQPCQGVAIPLRTPAAGRLAADRRASAAQRERSLLARPLLHRKLPDQKQVRRIFRQVGSRDERLELNLYIVGDAGGRMSTARCQRREGRGDRAVARAAPGGPLRLTRRSRDEPFPPAPTAPGPRPFRALVSG